MPDKDQASLLDFVTKNFEKVIEMHDDKMAECLTSIKDAFNLVTKLSVNKLVTSNQKLKEKLRKYENDISLMNDSMNLGSKDINE